MEQRSQVSSSARRRWKRRLVALVALGAAGPALWAMGCGGARAPGSVGMAPPATEITTRSRPLRPEETMPTPGPRARGGATGDEVQLRCPVGVDNRSRWRVQIFVGGDYQGLVGAFGDSVVDIPPGQVPMVAFATADGTPVRTWNATLQCEGAADMAWNLEE